MNGKVVLTRMKYCMLVCAFGSSPTWGWTEASVFNDPLQVRPPVLETGALLPTDSTPIACASEAVVPSPLTIGDAVDVALCNSPQIRATWAAIKTQVGAVGEARAAYLPTATGTVSSMRTRNEYPGYPGANSTTSGHTVYLGLNWRLFDLGTREANREASERLLAAAITSHDAMLQKTLASVASTYFDALSAQAAMHAREEAAKLAQATLDATERRERRGAAGQSDTLQARTALAKAQLSRQRSTSEFRKAVSMLVYALGLKPSVSLDLAQLGDGGGIGSVGDLTQWLDDASSRHPAISAARAQWNAAKAKVRKTRAEGLPSIDLTANFYQNGYPNQGLQGTRNNVTTVGVTLTIPLFEGFARTYKVRGAEAQAEQSAAQYEDTQNQILTDVVKAYADADSAAGNLAASELLLRSARAAMVSSEKRYEKGATDILELLSVQASLSDALQERARCLSDWRSTRLRLVASAGVLGREQVRSMDAKPH